ncbi:hypothetical protein [Roseateles sp.]|uniref:hypothetical protein n=1 Tax=Roseateles sp. TaxID=1971397 RepID=UPI0032670312
MNRLQSELRRLYLLPAAADSRLISDRGEVRAMVLELARPADWDVLSQVWRGVQADLQLPAPAIAVSGTDGLQLWFSLQEPLSASRAAVFLMQLRARYLAGIAPARLQCMPSATEPSWQAALVPAQQAATENWSAFVAPDLAPVFADTPWLDIPPSVEGQADLLTKLRPIKPAALDEAMRLLQPLDAPSSTARPHPGNTPDIDPRRFLQQVLNDETVELALRIDAAKALLHRT